MAQIDHGNRIFASVSLQKSGNGTDSALVASSLKARGWYLLDGPLQYNIPQENLQITLFVACRFAEVSDFRSEPERQITIVVLMPPERSPSLLTCLQLHRVLLHLQTFQDKILDQALSNKQSHPMYTVAELSNAMCSFQLAYLDRDGRVLLMSAKPTLELNFCATDHLR
ncbi:hypothetical protein FGIG_01212 [Fasciola gigantica]|uniref:Uncharacterized protein n=1 Tax=Fasciola gigantica TaxID=46835 RepID=A0A504YEU2_FASGI|nr:hypothetical protein FGIG_01212 [Fasciola gigantica]